MMIMAIALESLELIPHVTSYSVQRPLFIPRVGSMKVKGEQPVLPADAEYLRRARTVYTYDLFFHLSIHTYILCIYYHLIPPSATYYHLLPPCTTYFGPAWAWGSGVVWGKGKVWGCLGQGHSRTTVGRFGRSGGQSRTSVWAGTLRA